MGHVAHVQRQSLANGQQAPPGHLGQPGDPGLGEQARQLLGPIVLDQLGEVRPRADQRQIAPDHVEQVGQLVQGRAPQPPADPGVSGVIGQLVERLGQIGIGEVVVVQLWKPLSSIVVHRAQLEEPKGPAAPSDPFLTKEGRARRVQTDEEHQRAQQGCSHRQQHQPSHQVHASLGELVHHRAIGEDQQFRLFQPTVDVVLQRFVTSAELICLEHLSGPVFDVRRRRNRAGCVHRNM